MVVNREIGEIFKRAAAWLPPPSYLIAVTMLAGLVAGSMAVDPGLAFISWYWAFAIAGCLLGIFGALRIALGLGAPRWIGAALALPCHLWLVNVVKLIGDQPLSSMERIVFGLAAQLAFLAAAAGALRLVEWLSKPRFIFRVGYWFLAVFAVLACVDPAVSAAGWTFARTPYWLMPFQAVRAAATLVACGAFIGAALVLSLRRGGEPWTGVVLSLIVAHMLYDAMRLTFVLEVHERVVSLWGPATMLVAAIAVWRIGTVLHAGAVARGPASVHRSAV
ncbi:hypothetical protein HL666_04115 [Bradyrhizobium sp. 83002]|uniref:hypothetical protein n=1 Tax=Bradyrhizobium aeschynomenes TaxID=2734909 RepID=UPI001553D696|nr:hypothetical protein [Bradyrhizobium aeschynomenes]NPU09938.1 hypothetical protein [Bradyrhizobium aeschynomenes]